MPVVPSFTGFAQTPDLAQAWLGGRQAALERQKLAQEAAATSARISLGYAQLQQAGVQNRLEFEAGKEQMAREAQEAEINKAYRETQLGLSRRSLENAERNSMMQLEEAARGFEEQQAWDREYPVLVEEGEKAGLSPQQAQVNAARTLMLKRGGPGVASALSAGREPSPLPMARFQSERIQDKIDDLIRPWQGLLIPPEVESQVSALRQQQSQLIPPTTGTATNAPANEVVRRTKDGKRAIFNAETKQFIRYAD